MEEAQKRVFDSGDVATQGIQGNDKGAKNPYAWTNPTIYDGGEVSAPLLCEQTGNAGNATDDVHSATKIELYRRPHEAHHARDWHHLGISLAHKGDRLTASVCCTTLWKRCNLLYLIPKQRAGLRLARCLLGADIIALASLLL